MYKSVFWLSLIFMFGCAGSQNTSMKYRMRDVPASFERTFQATTDYLKERGFTLQKADEKTGVIETAYRPGSGWGRGFTGDRRARVIAKIARIDKNRSHLTLDLISETRDLSTGWQTIIMNVSDEQIVYRRFFNGIIARAIGKSIN